MKPTAALFAVCIILASLLLSACPGKNMQGGGGGGMQPRSSRY